MMMMMMVVMMVMIMMMIYFRIFWTLQSLVVHRNRDVQYW